MNTTKTRKVLIVGCGVIGLTTAIRLREQGHSILIIAHETPSTILSRDSSLLKGQAPAPYSSTGAGGLWMPFMLDGDKVEQWSTVAHEEFTRQQHDNVGVKILDAFFLQSSKVPDQLPWFSKLTNMTVETPQTDQRIPAEYVSAFRFSTPIIEMWPYMRHLEERAKKLGVEIELTAQHNETGESTDWNAEQVADFALARFPNERPVVINCCGVAAGKIANDEMTPARGIIVRVERPQGKQYMISEDPNDGHLSKDGTLAYCIPRGDEYSLGGTSYWGDWREEASEEEVANLIERANKLIDGIGSMKQTGVWCGFRPMRKDGTARVEVQTEGLGGREGLDVIANYGHGGSGVTTCWGCAEDVVRIVEGFESMQ